LSQTPIKENTQKEAEVDVRLVTDKKGNPFNLVTQNADSNDCWANCIVMAENQSVRCLKDPLGRVKSILSKYKNLTVNGGMSFNSIVNVCMGEGLKTERYKDNPDLLGVRLKFKVGKFRPAIVGLMKAVEGGIAGHVVVCLGWQDQTYLLLDPLATTLVELPETQFPKYVASYGRTWDFVGESLIFPSPYGG
jgi:hypothetical protein